MKCEDAQTVMMHRAKVDPAEHSAAEEHLQNCTDCQHALHAFQVLSAEAEVPVPEPTRRAFDRAILAATKPPAVVPRRRREFWSGVGLGSAIAAGIAAAMVTLSPLLDRPIATNTPTVSMAVNEVKDISISIDSPERLVNAEIHVVLNGAIALRGFDTQKELRWSTDLDRGVNQLTLPVIVLGETGGQLLVEVQYGDNRKTFLVDIRTDTRRREAV